MDKEVGATVDGHAVNFSRLKTMGIDVDLLFRGAMSLKASAMELGTR